MLRGLDKPSENELRRWIRDSVNAKANIFGYGYQGHVYLYEDKGCRLIVKAPAGRGVLARLIHRWMLRNEQRAYQQLSQIDSVPKCYGLLDDRYLVLEYIDGVPLREAVLSDRHEFFKRLLRLIKALHRAGVAHGDLKKKDNLLVVDGCTPCIIDFGVATVRKRRFAPINAYRFSVATRFDYNAWVKLRSDSKTRHLLHMDEEYYSRTVIEKVARKLKRGYRRFKRGIRDYRNKSHCL